MKKYHLISGLPRSGSTLLSTILAQNPRFESSISSPLARYVRSIIQESSTQGGYRFECPPEKRKILIKGLFENYYNDPTKEVAFNTNRGWGLLLPTVKDLFPYTKIILCVRDLGWILNSFEHLIRSNPYSFTNMFSQDENLNVYTRCETLMNPGRTVGFAYTALKQVLTSEFKNSIFLIEYDNLAKNPEQVIKALYHFINEPYYEHDYKNVEASYKDFDEDVQLPGLHTVRKEVSFLPKQSLLPPDIWHKVEGMEVWRGGLQ